MSDLATIGIVAHVDRFQQASDLCERVNGFYLAYDSGTLGCTANHLRVWERLAHMDTPWVLVLEDDAVPVDDFRAQLDMALDAAPSPVVSLYLGTSNPTNWQKPIERALFKRQIERSHWLTCTNMLHAVAIAMRTELIASMVASVRHDTVPIDEAITRWVRRQGITVSYTVPSLCDHADWPTVIETHADRKPRDKPRKAWRFGPRYEWSSAATQLVY